MSAPTAATVPRPATGTPVVRAADLSRHYEVGGGMFGKRKILKALSRVSFELEAGKTLSVVGESGCGTCSRAGSGSASPSPAP